MRILSSLLVIAMITMLSTNLYSQTNKLFYIDEDPREIRQSDLNGANNTVFFKKTTNLYPKYITVSNGSQEVFFVGTSPYGIYKMNMNGTNEQLVYTPTSTIYELEVDETNSKLYWAGYESLGSCNLDGTGVTIHRNTTGTSYRGIAINGTVLYWCEGTYVAPTNFNTIYSGTLTATGAAVVHSESYTSPALPTTLGSLYGLDIDGTNGHIYWACNTTDGIYRKNADGTGGVTTLYSNPGNFSPRALALDVPNNKMYWANTQSGSDNVSYANLDGTGVTVIETLTDPRGIDVAAVTAVPAGSSEIDVQGNGVSIVNNDITPATADNTDFGSVPINNNYIDHYFFIRNLGGVALNLTGAPIVNVTGAHAADFTVQTMATTPVGGTSGTYFVLRFDPSVIGLRTATITIANSDSDEGTYSFNVQGTGDVSSGETGTNDFRITTHAQGGNLDNEDPGVAYDPTNNRFLVVFEKEMINSDEEVFGQFVDGTTGALIGGEFRISVTGVDGNIDIDAGDPEIVFNSTNNQYLVVWRADRDAASGSTEYEIFGQIINADGTLVGGLGTGTFRISQIGPDGDVNWYVYGAEVAWNSTDNEYYVVWYGSISSGGTYEIFGQRVSNTGTIVGGLGSETQLSSTGGASQYAYYPSVAYNSTDNQYLVTYHADVPNDNDNNILGQLVAANGTLISGLGSPIFVTSVAASRDADYTSVLYNPVNNEYFAVFQADIGITDNEDEIYGQRVSNTGTLVGGNFQVSYTGVDGDGEEASTYCGMGYNSTDQQILVTFIAEEPSSSARDVFAATFDASTYAFLETQSRVSDMGNTNGDNQYAALKPRQAYNPTENSFLIVWEGDDDDPTYGRGNGEDEIYGQMWQSPPVSEIDVQGNYITIADGDVTPVTTDNTDFGSTGVGVGVAHTFKVLNRNSGQLVLDGTTTVAISGTNAAEFVVTTNPATAIAGGDSTEFEITFTPTAAGLRTANVTIDNNDAGEDPYNFNIQGTATSCTDPTVPTVTFTPATVCNGNNATLNISGTLNDATAWQVYTGSCGGTNIGSTAGTTFVVTPSSPSTTYYVRGEGGCVTAGSCGTVAVTVTAIDDASFSYSAASYCVDASDPTPTITGLTGGGFTSTPAGLSINPTTGAIDVSLSTPNTYTVTYTTTGTCPNSSNVAVTINGLDDASFSYGAASYCPNGTDPTPTITGLTGGSFSSTAGLSIVGGSGLIDLSASTPSSYTVTYTTAGTCPNSSNVAVTVGDVVNPTITCPGNQTETANASCQVVLPDYTGLATVSDACDASPVVTQSPVAGTTISGTTTVTLTATDASSNTASCTFDVLIDDATAPTAVCQNINAYLDGTGNVTITAADIDNGSSDNCGAVTLSASVTSFTCANLGANNVTLTVTDGNSNTANCVAVVTVLDTVSPVVTCPGNQTENPDASCNFTLPDYTGLVAASDNCTGSPTVTQSPVAGTVISGTTTITMTATDGGSNTSTCTFDVILNDVTAPTAVCQNINAYLDGAGNVAIIATDLDGGSTDNCSGLTFAASQTAFTCADIGANNVTLTVTDGNSNTDNCVAVVTVMDTISPVAVCQNITTYLDGSGNATITAADIDNGSTDNCAAITLSASVTAFTCADIGTNNVTLTVTDASANTSTCVAVVTVLDTVSPTASCPGNQTENVDGACQVSLPDYTGLVTTTDNCAVAPTVSQSPVAGTVISATTTVTMTTDDGNGNTTTCTFDVNLVDATAPTAVCQNINAYLDGAGNVTITAADIDGGSSDNCGAVTLSASATAFTCADLGANNVTLTVTDGSANSDNCIAVVTVMDTVSPVIACPGDQTENPDASCNFTLPDYTGLVTASDNCGTATITQSPAIGTVISAPTTITMTADDGNGNTSTCTFDVLFDDVIAPTITCSGDQNVDFSATCDYTLIDFTSLATATDNCSGVTVSQSPAVGTVITGTTTVTLTATDGAGNTADCTFDVIPADNTNPTVTCPSDQNELVDANCEYIIPDYTTMATASDNCASSITLTQNPVAGTVVGVSTTTITITADDGNGNTTDCSFTLTVTDNIAPTITCPGDQSDSYDDNCAFALLDYTVMATVLATDNCGTPTITQSPVPGTLVTSNTTITLTADDGNGNTTDCTFNLTLSDTTRPVVDCPSDETIYLDGNCQVELPDYTFDGTIFDNCDGNLTITQSPVAGTLYEAAEIVDVTITAADASGNVDSCSFVVIVDADENSGCVDNLVVSDLITPNGDGKNDYWIIHETSYIIGCEVFVYNRWGQQVFQAENYDNTWDGTYQNKPLPDGAYYYVIVCDGEVKYKGDLSILKLKK